MRFDGRPLFILYNPSHLPDAAKTIARWREKLKTVHGEAPLLFMAQSFGERDPAAYGLDGAMEFPPHKVADKLPGRPMPDAYSARFSGRVIDYEQFAAASLDEPAPGFPLIKTVVPGWDNDSRRPGRGLVLEGAHPAKYQAWLTGLAERAYDHPVCGVPMLAVNAWNEWAEAAYLEPDVHFGGAWLNATARALVAGARAHRRRAAHNVAVILPNYNHARFIAERVRSVVNQTHPPDEILFLDDGSSDGSVEIAAEILAGSGIDHRIIVNDANSGNVFRQWLKGLALARNDLIWIAETDDSCAPDFLEKLLPSFDDASVMGAYGRIAYIDEEGEPLDALDNYYDGLTRFGWEGRRTVPAFEAFREDFAVKNVIPNASGLVFRKPLLREAECARLLEYRFAGDWYFYALLFRGGRIGYEPEARSLFRLVDSSASRSRFSSERHLLEHRMILQDLEQLYGLPEPALKAHARALKQFAGKRSLKSLTDYLRPVPGASAAAHRHRCAQLRHRGRRGAAGGAGQHAEGARAPCLLFRARG